MRAWMIFVMAIVVSCGCSFELDLGDQTRGEENNSNWSFTDGLCPGFGRCGLDVPVASGASPRLRIEVRDRTVEGLDVTVEGPGTLSEIEVDVDDEVIRLAVDTTGPGEVLLHIVDLDGEEVDRVRFQTRDPSGLRCGLQPAGESPTITGELIVDAHDASLIVPATSSDEGGSLQLACVVMDELGDPLLSVDVVRWNVITGSEMVTIRSEPFELGPGSSTNGARIYVEAVAGGTAEIEAQVGDAVESFTITVE